MEAPFQLRDYQKHAVDAFNRVGEGGSGVLVLPCGAGKTVVGIAAMAKCKLCYIDSYIQCYFCEAVEA